MRTTYSHDLARPRRTLQETQASSRQVSKKIKKIKQIQKNKRKALWTLAVTSQCRIIIASLRVWTRISTCTHDFRSNLYLSEFSVFVSGPATPTTRAATVDPLLQRTFHLRLPERYRTKPQYWGTGKLAALQDWPEWNLVGSHFVLSSSDARDRRTPWQGS